MKILKNKRLYRTLGMSLFLSIVSVPSAAQQNKMFEVNQSLSEWPKRSLSAREEEICYEQTWDRNKKLEENQRELIKRFMSSCCDFSFKIKAEGLSGIYSGKFDDGENVVFINKETHITASHSLDRVMFFNEKDKGRGLEVHPRTSLLQNVKPLDFEEWMKCEFERYIQRFVEDPVGCEILRVSIAKYEAGQSELPKIKFIPQADPKMNLAYTPGGYVWKYARRIGRSDFSGYAEFCRENKYIMFSPEWFNTDQTGLILKLRKTKSGSDDFTVSSGIIPREAGLMYQIIYAMHVGKGTDYEGTEVIEKRDDKNYYRSDFEGVGPFSILRKRLNVSIFKNDKIYRVMYGLTRRGFDLINESSYLAHKYSFIRPAYAGSKAGININGKRLDKKESCRFLRKFLKTNGDFDLYKYFLSKKSSIRYPEFGRGKYRCADVDFERERGDS